MSLDVIPWMIECCQFRMDAFENSMLDEKQFLYVIGSPRSGTTMLQVLLGNHPQVASTVELTLFDRYLGPWISAWEDETNNIQKGNWDQGLPMLWDQAEFDSFVRTFLERAYGKLASRYPDATHILDKHPGYSLHTAAIHRYIPNARFIHIIRDGRDVACSLLAARRTMGFGVERISEAALRWRKMVIAARDAAAFGPNAYLELRYESFLEDSEAAYRKILDFCGLSWTEDWLQQTVAANRFDQMKERRATGDPNIQVSQHHYRKGKAGSWKEEFSQADCYEFDRHAGDLLNELGYCEPDWWAANKLEQVYAPVRYTWSEGKRLVLESARRNCQRLIRGL